MREYLNNLAYKDLSSRVAIWEILERFLSLLAYEKIFK